MVPTEKLKQEIKTMIIHLEETTVCLKSFISGRQLNKWDVVEFEERSRDLLNQVKLK